MSVLLLIGGFVVVSLGIVLYDGYRYSVCPQCECNLYCKRIKRKVFCQIHGEIERRK